MTTLFPRRTRTKHAQHAPEVRLRAVAHQILDRARAGHEVSAADIRWALRVTGDLA